MNLPFLCLTKQHVLDRWVGSWRVSYDGSCGNGQSWLITPNDHTSITIDNPPHLKQVAELLAQQEVTASLAVDLKRHANLSVVSILSIIIRLKVRLSHAEGRGLGMSRRFGTEGNVIDHFVRLDEQRHVSIQEWPKWRDNSCVNTSLGSRGHNFLYASLQPVLSGGYRGSE